MTQFEFIALCGQHLIDPGIALENEDLCAALAADDDAEVARILHDEF